MKPKADSNRNTLQLTDNDLLFEDGKEDELLGRLQKRTGEAKEKLRSFINEKL